LFVEYPISDAREPPLYSENISKRLEMPKMSEVPKMPKIHESLRSVVFKIKIKHNTINLGILGTLDIFFVISILGFPAMNKIISRD
jgi:hypothetical protein